MKLCTCTHLYCEAWSATPYIHVYMCTYTYVYMNSITCTCTVHVYSSLNRKSLTSCLGHNMLNEVHVYICL